MLPFLANMLVFSARSRSLRPLHDRLLQILLILLSHPLVVLSPEIFSAFCPTMGGLSNVLRRFPSFGWH